MGTVAENYQPLKGGVLMRPATIDLESERDRYETPEISKLGHVEVVTRNIFEEGTGDTFADGKLLNILASGG